MPGAGVWFVTAGVAVAGSGKALLVVVSTAVWAGAGTVLLSPEIADGLAAAAPGAPLSCAIVETAQITIIPNKNASLDNRTVFPFDCREDLVIVR